MDLKQRLQKGEIKLPEDFFKNIQKYKELLHKWNKIHNLTGAKTPEMVDEFIYDSVYPVKFLPKVSSLLDIGTGAGFPGMILALALKDTQVTLAEPLSKRAAFLQFVKADLGLENVTVLKQRVQDMPKTVFELITSRAVTDTQMLLKLSEDFRDKNSKILFYKGENVYNEVDETMHYKIIKKPHRHYLLIGENI